MYKITIEKQIGEYSHTEVLEEHIFLEKADTKKDLDNKIKQAVISQYVPFGTPEFDLILDELNKNDYFNVYNGEILIRILKYEEIKEISVFLTSEGKIHSIDPLPKEGETVKIANILELPF